MGSKKRRKSIGPAEKPLAKKSSSTGGGRAAAEPLAWTSSGLQVVLPADKALLFVGRGMLAVQSGEVEACGRFVSALDAPIELAADEKVGGALALQVHSSEGQVPLASRCEAVFSISPSSSSSNSGSSNNSTSSVAWAALDGISSSWGSSSYGSRLGFHACLQDDPAAPIALRQPPLWQESAAQLLGTLALPGAPPPVIAVCGAKKVGKSTFARYLVNSLLNQYTTVAYLDTDCGQPEFTPPGLLALTLLQQPVLGPPHMHMQQPATSHFLGDLSPACDPLQYISHIRSLYRWYCRHAAAAAAAVGASQTGDSAGGQAQAALLPPIVVNTHGWVKGMGYDVLVELLQSLPITHYIQIASPNPKKNLPPGCFWLHRPQPAAACGEPSPEPHCWLLPPLTGPEQQQWIVQQQQPTASEGSARSHGLDAASEGGGSSAVGAVGLPAVDLRSLQWLAFARQCVHSCGLPKGTAAGAVVEAGDALAAAMPYAIHLSEVEVSVLHSAVPPSQLGYTLNGAVVALCSQNPTATLPPSAAAVGGDRVLGLRSQQPASLPCLGLGIVRAADTGGGRLLVLTPVPEQRLEEVTVLQLGSLELPVALLQTGSFMAPYLSLFSLSTAGTGSGAIKSRKNLLRQSQL